MTVTQKVSLANQSCPLPKKILPQPTRVRGLEPTNDDLTAYIYLFFGILPVPPSQLLSSREVLTVKERKKKRKKKEKTVFGNIFAQGQEIKR